MKKIFITRDLEVGSVFHKTLTDNGFEALGQSLVRFSPVPFGPLPSTDWVFFYSKNAVRFFLDGRNKPTMEGRKTAALGEGTASALKGAGFLPDFVGKGEPEQVAAAFLQVAENQRVLFPRASESRQTIQKALGNQIQASDLVVYENIAKQDFQIPDCQALVFTSPLNANAYFAKYKLKSEVVIAIGQTTADALRAGQGTDRIHIAENPSENALAELAIELLVNKRQD